MTADPALLCSPCAEILLDSALAPISTLVTLGAELGGGGGDERRLSLLGEAEAPQRTAFARLLAAGDDPIAALAAAWTAGDLAGCLLVTARDRLAGWARQQGLPVLVPVTEAPLAPQLAPRSLVLRDAAALVLRARRRHGQRPLLVGVNGIANAGKTRFAADLAVQLGSLGFNCPVLSLDIFTAPRKVREAKGYSEPERLLLKTYSLERLDEQLLRPLQAETAPSLQLDVFDRERDRVAAKMTLDMDSRSIVLLEGPFLYQEQLVTPFDYRIYLVTSFTRAIELELGELAGKAREARRRDFIDGSIAAHSLYLRRATPWRHAHLQVRDANTEQPRIAAWRDPEVIAAHSALADR
jgi:uridine kinase